MHGPNRSSIPASTAGAAGLSSAKRALLEKLRGAKAAVNEVIPRRASGGPAPLSFSQQRLWFLDQLEPENPFYNVAIAARVVGLLDAEVLEAALQAVVARHAALRTTFRSVAGMPEQVVRAPGKLALARIDLSDMPVGKREARLQNLASDEAVRPFDLAHGPLMRATLVRTGDDQHTLLLTLHHIICDGWSIAVIRSELAAYYEALRAGRAADLPPPPLDYVDFATWQRGATQTQKYAEQLAFWREQLDELPGPLELPLDHPRPAVQTFRGAVSRRRLENKLVAKLRALAASQNATPAMLLMAAYQLLLARLSGERDLCVGTPIAGRNRPELEPLVGFFVNTLVIRARLGDNPTFGEFLARQRATMLSAYAHQELPFERLVDKLQPQRGLSRNPLVQAMFVMQNIALPVQQISGLTMVEATFDHAPVANSELTLNVDEHPDQLDLSLVYNTDLFEPATAARMLDEYETLLTAIVDDPDCSVLALPILSAAERQKMLVDWNNTDAQLPHEPCVHDLFIAQAKRTPAAIAVRAENESLSYAELDRRSNQLARYLIDRGVDRGEAVGLCFGRTPDLIVAMLAILKSGAAYVPLDPLYPQARREYMIRDAALQLVITNQATVSCLPAGDYDRLLVDREQADIAACDGATLPERASNNDVAYVIYTSGSTGEPKGVEVEHRGLVNHATAFGKLCSLGVGDRLLQFLSLSFDAAAEEIFPSLAAGATLVLHESPAELSGQVLLDWSREHNVNVLHLPVAVWSSLVDALSPENRSDGAHLKVVIAGGDTVPAEKLARWRAATADATRFLFAYGVTEASITSAIFDGRSELPATASHCLPIGRAIANTRLYVVDEQGAPAPVGVPGELWIGGTGIARGYRERPALTAERFRSDPFDRSGEGRVYRTGDRVRWLNDGSLEFLGRIDRQVKIRGHRIEPAEIETLLQLHPAVREAVVITCGSGEMRRLAAYVGCGGKELISEPTLREFLAARLPQHMLPAALVILPELPRLSCAKVDTAALREPDWRRAEPIAGIAAPCNDLEQTLCRIWADVLGLENVGAKENFFELGGDSIRSIQVVARLAATGWRITPKQLFQNQTVAALAQVAEKITAVTALQGPIVGPATLLPIQHEFFALKSEDQHHHNQALLLRVKQGIQPETIERALGKLLEHHDALRARFSRDNAGTWRQELLTPTAECVMARINLSDTPDKELAATLEQHYAATQASLDIERGPLTRFVYFDLGPRHEARLLMVIHHLVVDAVSWRILLADLDVLCRQAGDNASGDDSELVLPPKTMPITAWAERLAELADSAETRAELTKWRENAPAGAHLPADFDRGENLVAASAKVSFVVEAGVTERILDEACTALRARSQELLLAALSKVVGEYCGGSSLWINVEGHGREDLSSDIDLSRTAGWFTTLYPLKIGAPTDRALAGWIKSAKSACHSVSDGGLSYGLLRWMTSDPAVRDLMTALPAAEICFNYLGNFDHTLPPGAAFALADESCGPMVSPRGARRHQWDIIAYVQDGQLRIEWTYSAARHRPETINRLADVYAGLLRQLADESAASGAAVLTPEDFSLAGIDQDDLDALAQMLSHEE